ncbi:TIGR02452 family protein [Streptomyces sp. NBC_00006]|uniref:TIGR02452 family protein n=1 Tax=unclassified Streptomyces TaxID=2593676 RepID=UPI0022598D99|nr:MULTISPECIES: TIGR02452 family protein [unclassified Streptomyces]MCX4831615.1 TIGR02452 family protein [Streptomyces sp. NBC_01016]MCX5536133.1 TIGR02452 family protein [Streptomyces sp. NBC_00006]
MSARLRELARSTEKIVDSGEYAGDGGRVVTIGAAVERARAGTRMYGPDPVPVPPMPPVDRKNVEVTGESSLEAARRMVGERPQPVAVLNFASARNPGGGYLNGAQAQEEALCRCSALYTCLIEVPQFYAHHREHRDAFYSDRVIHAPAVPVFRDDQGRLLDAPFEAGFLTSPAPNAGVIAQRTPERVHEIPAALAARAERVLEVAGAEGYRRLVLGAWGCGVFRNDPGQVAEAFRAPLEGRFADRFEQVVFAVLDRTKGAATRSAFERAFGPARLSPRGVGPTDQRQP